MKVISCPMCAERGHTGICSRSRAGRTYSVVRCVSCGFHYVNPEPDPAELLALYDAGYSDDHDQIWHGAEDELNGQVIDALRQRGIRSLTDLGAGQGRFVRQALDAGIEARGAEPSGVNCRVAREKYGVALEPVTVQQFLAAGPVGLECVTMLNVLEHLPDPVSVLRQCSRVLPPGGTLAVVVPNVDFTLTLGRVRRAAGFRDVFMLESPRFSQQGFDPPIHLSSFSARHLRHAAAQAGFQVDVLSQAAVIRSANPIARFAKRTVATIGRTLEVATQGRMVWGYSLLCIARRI